MPITVRYAQEIPTAIAGTDGKDGAVGKDGKVGKDGTAGAAGADLTILPPQYVDANAGDTITVDLSVSHQWRISAFGNFNVHIINGVDGTKFSISVIQKGGGPYQPTFDQELYWNTDIPQPTLSEGVNQHCTIGFEQWGAAGSEYYDAYLVGTALHHVLV